jgi:hypothetical protein
MPGVVAAVLIVFIPTVGDYVTPELIGGGKVPMIANLIQALMLKHRRPWPGLGPGGVGHADRGGDQPVSSCCECAAS